MAEVDKELEETIIDQIVVDIGSQIVEEESKVSLINEERLKEMEVAYKIIKYLFDKSNSKVGYKLHQPFQSMGSINITSKNIKLSRPELFIRACDLASNVDIFPKTNGTIEIDLTFHNLTTPIE